MTKDFFIGCSNRQSLTERNDVVAPVPQYVAYFGRHVVVE